MHTRRCQTQRRRSSLQRNESYESKEKERPERSRRVLCVASFFPGPTGRTGLPWSRCLAVTGWRASDSRYPSYGIWCSGACQLGGGSKSRYYLPGAPASGNRLDFLTDLKVTALDPVPPESPLPGQGEVREVLVGCIPPPPLAHSASLGLSGHLLSLRNSLPPYLRCILRVHGCVISAPSIPVQREPLYHCAHCPSPAPALGLRHYPAPPTCPLYLCPYYHLPVPFSSSGQFLFVLQGGALLSPLAGKQPRTSSVRWGPSASPRIPSPGPVSSQSAGGVTLGPGTLRELDPCLCSPTGSPGS